MNAMTRNSRTTHAVALALLAVLALGAAAPARAEMETGRAAWLLNRDGLEDLALTGMRFEQSEIGGGAGDESLDVAGLDNGGGGMKGALPVLMSLILPGAGEVATGHKRGYLMAAVDIFAWTRVAKYHNDGEDMKQAYLDFADAHYTDDNLVLAYTTADGGYRDNIGTDYFGITANSVAELDNLPLYVSKDDDFREYYENLGKWNQFVFGWDDFVRPDDAASIGVDYTPTGDQKIDLEQPWVSRNRETYRVMRGQSNDAYKKRDRWLYVNIGLRVFSVLQVAYLQGMLGGGGDDEGQFKVGGHPVEIRATPLGFEAGVVSAKVAF